MFYLINKTKGISSFKAIKQFAFEHKIKKIGHTGTLDPLATGLLLVATEEDTVFIDYIDKGSKTYIAKMQFGFVSDSYDIDGKVSNLGCIHNHTIDEFEKVINQFFIGKISQIPPIFSAKKIAGQRAYELARKGIKVEMKKQNIEVFEHKILSWNSQTKILEVQYVVSRGTYIRSLIHDLAQQLHCNAIMTELIRNAIGNLTLNDLNRSISVVSLLDLPTLELKEQQLLSLLKGIRVKLNTNIDKLQKFVLLYKEQLIGIGSIEKGILFSNKLLGNKIAKLI